MTATMVMSVVNATPARLWSGKKRWLLPLALAALVAGTSMAFLCSGHG